MSAALHGSSAIRRFEPSNAIEIRDGITFDFYTGLPHIVGVDFEYHFVVLNKPTPLLQFIVDIPLLCNSAV